MNDYQEWKEANRRKGSVETKDNKVA